MNIYRRLMFEPLDITENKRESNMPLGLKNIGNTCFINSLLQCYFMIPPLVKEVMAAFFGTGNEEVHPATKFVKALQTLFAKMIKSTRKYADPSEVIDSLVDSFGNQVEFGEQQDIGEFHMIIVDNIEKGLNLCKQDKGMKLWVSLKEQGKIESLFTGIHEEVLQYKKAGEYSQTSNDVKFGPIILDIDKGNLMAAWENAYKSTIKDYRIKDTKVKAKQEIWIKILPSVLIFQLKRHSYIQGEPVPLKNNSVFKFPDFIFPDRFMQKNKDQIKLLQKKIRKIKSEIKMIKKENAGLLYSPDGKTSILESIQVLNNFLISDIGNEATTKANRLSKNLEGMYYEIENKIEANENRLKRLNRKLEKIYRQFTDQKYCLSSILVHEGVAISGHYFAYIKDYDRPEPYQWRKYNDIFVTNVQEEEVKKVSEGLNNASAYCLIYVSEDLIKAKTELPLHLFEPNSGREFADEYSTYMKEEIIASVKNMNNQDNENRESEVYEEQVDKIVDDLNQIFIEDIETYQVLKTDSQNYYHLELAEFAIFVLSKNNYSQIVRYFRIESYIRQYYKLEITDPAMKKLRDYLQKRNTEFNPLPTSLKSDEYTFYIRLKNQYIEEITDLIYANIILEQARSFNFKKSLQIYILCVLQINRAMNTIKNELYEVFKYILIYLIRNLQSECKNKSITRVVEYCELINLLYNQYCDKEFGRGVLSLVTQIHRKFYLDFKKDKDQFESAFNLAISLEINDMTLIKFHPDVEAYQYNLLSFEFFDKNHYEHVAKYKNLFTETLTNLNQGLQVVANIENAKQYDLKYYPNFF
ncbi:hypothetical protein SteCoe_32332 [Stentor coeruleus]|uniref:Ubiquitin carboxyl-terminal hydrolase n=1 Tax=Stentor coeruleus TaxID=5963 RepID=A0A1R2AZ97_9CILI|nr:hypothetical protein SteCoe_32332 [Stentor coeruleus]